MEDQIVDRWIERYLLKTPPRCVANFRCTPTDPPEAATERFPNARLHVAWDLTCSCGKREGMLMGYSLHDFNREYTGPQTMISPLGFKCLSCSKTTEIFDTDLHGFSVEISKVEGGIGSAHIRGNGQRLRHHCRSCAADEMAATVGFVFWDFDLLFGEVQSIEEGRWQEEDFDHAEDYFHSFYCYGECRKCGDISEFSTFGKV